MQCQSSDCIIDRERFVLGDVQQSESIGRVSIWRRALLFGSKKLIIGYVSFHWQRPTVNGNVPLVAETL